MNHESENPILQEPRLRITLGMTPEKFEPLRTEFIKDLARISGISSQEIQDVEINFRDQPQK
jgi:hypothetical protein